MTNLNGMLGLLIVLAGGSLLYHLGARRVPRVLKPAADVWARAGYDPKWGTASLWAVFALLAAGMLIFVGIPLYAALGALGQGIK